MSDAGEPFGNASGDAFNSTSLVAENAGNRL